MKAYFDRNVFGEIKQLTDASETHPDIATLRRAVDDDRLSVLLSTTVLEETVPAARRSTETLKKEFEVIFGLVENRRMIKTADDLLREALQSYGLNRSQPDMFTRTPRFVTNFLKTGKLSGELMEFIKAVASQTGSFAERLNDSFSEAKRIGEERQIGRPDNLAQFWSDMAPAIASWRAEQHGVQKQCANRGIEGLLENRTVRLYTIYYSAWVFAKWFGEQGTPGKVKTSERGDFFHAVQASAADVLVTNDARFSRWLREIPVQDFDVMSLKQLTERLS